jgi:hypothetical protein
MLLQMVVDTKTFDYLPKDVLDNLNLNLLNFPEALLLFREEYLTALDRLKLWEKPLVKGVVVTGYPGIGTPCNTMRSKLLYSRKVCGSRDLREDILPALRSPPAAQRGIADRCAIRQGRLYSFYRPGSDPPCRQSRPS